MKNRNKDKKDGNKKTIKEIKNVNTYKYDKMNLSNFFTLLLNSESLFLITKSKNPTFSLFLAFLIKWLKNNFSNNGIIINPNNGIISVRILILLFLNISILKFKLFICVNINAIILNIRYFLDDAEENNEAINNIPDIKYIIDENNNEPELCEKDKI